MISLTESVIPPLVERPLGAIEKLFYLLNQSHPNHFAMVGEVDGPTDIEQWQNGLNQVARHSPSVWTRIERDGDGIPVFRPVPHGSIRLKVVTQDAAGWAGEVAAQIAEPFDELQPPLLRATLIHGETQSTIVLAAHHSIGDGLSLTFLLGDLLRAVSGQKLVRRHENQTVERLIERMHGVTLGSAPLPKHAVSETAAVKRQPKEFRFSDGSAPHIEALCLTSEMTNNLRDRARTESSTVQSVLIAALVTAISRLSPTMCKEPLRVLSPVDLRRRLLDHSDHLAACVSGIVLVDDLPLNTDFWSRARHLGKAFDGIQAPAELAAMVLGIDRMLADVNATTDAKALLAEMFASEALVTNLGVVNLPRKYGQLSLERIWGPSVSMCFVGGQTIGASTFGSRLHLLYTSFAPIHGLLDQMAIEIAAALQ